MGNYVKGFRFTNGYEEVFTSVEEGRYIYVEAEPFMWADCMSALDYVSNGDGTYSTDGIRYGISVDSLTSYMCDEHAPLDVAEKIIGAEFIRAWACSMQWYDDEPADIANIMGLVDIASCRLSDTNARRPTLEPDQGETYSDFLARWENALAKSGVRL